jgi:hypothetical protein
MTDDLGSPEYPLSAIEAAFWDFHLQNPQIYELFHQFATQSAARKGRKHFGVAAVFERIRWSVMVETEGGGEFKLNNNYRAYYARLWMRDNPQYQGFFRTREVKGANHV